MQQQLVAKYTNGVKPKYFFGVYWSLALWMPFTSWIVYVLLEKGQAIETDDNALLFRVQFGLNTGVIYFLKLYLMFYT